MIRYQLRTALRSLQHRRLFTVINVAGLAMAVACSWPIGLWVLDELNFDRFLPNAERVFRIETTTASPDGKQLALPAVGWPVGKTIQANFPEVEQLTYLKAWSPQLKHRGAYLKEQGLMADDHFLGVLGYELAQGDPKTALKEPFSVVLSPEAEAKYFGKGGGMGKLLMINDTLPHRVTGILKDVPRQGHLQFTMVRSLTSLHTLFPQDMTYEYADGWFDINVANYVLLRKGVNAQAFAAKIRPLVERWGREKSKQTGMHSTLQLRPLPEVYLRSKMPTTNGPVGDSNALYLFGAIGVFILLIASLNVINLTTAGASERAKEVGIKKALGGHPAQLTGQFLTEAALVCISATAIGVALVVVLLPTFSTFTGKPFTVANLMTPLSLGLLVGFLLVLIPITGAYPAWVLTRYGPITALRGRLPRSAGGVGLRKGLVVA